MSKLGIGIIGCGNISTAYLTLAPLFKGIEVRAVADINPSAAQEKADEFNVRAQSVEDLLGADDIDIVVNLTIPAAHFSTTRTILQAGKHAYSEKPLVLSLQEGKELAALAAENGLRVGSAPDTFLGGAHQQARALIDQGSLGDIVGGTAHVMSHGMEHWHPNPDFFFKPGAGPVFDVGVYYITQLVNLIGPIKSISSLSGTATPERTITSEPRNGEKIKVETPTTLMGTLEFHNNAKIQFFCSWDVWKHKHSTIELYGLEGSMIVPDPNFFSGDILISHKEEDWQVINNDNMLLGIPNKTDNNGDKIANYRGIGLSDMIDAISHQRQSRCSLDLAIHVLEAMEGIIKSSEERVIYNMKTKPNQPDFLDESEIIKFKK